MLVVDVVYWLVLAVPALTALLITLWNLVVWPRGTTNLEGDQVDVSVLIPARNEQDTIEACVRSAAQSRPRPDEILVYDDRSNDATRSILDNLAKEFDENPTGPDLQIIDGEPLPDGWIGKPHACHQLALRASGNTFVYVDADTTLRREGIARLLSLLASNDANQSNGADLVTAVPRQHFGSFAERLVMPLLHLTYTSWLPQNLVYSTQDSRFLAANGQLMAIDRDSLRQVGGFEAVRRDVVDDMALGRCFKQAGRTVVFADGYHMADCRMYESGSELTEGFSKNLYEGIGSSILALFGVVALYVMAFFAPYGVVGVGVATELGGALPQAAFNAAIVGVGANLSVRAILTWRFSHPIEGIVLHPLAIVWFVVIAINSGRWHLTDTVRWSGRTYTGRSNR